MKKQTKTFLGILFLLSTTYCLLSTAEGAVPHLVRYQGFVTDTEGVGLNQTSLVVFSIYNVETGGTALWTETQNVTFIQGNFSVLLGEVTPLNLPFDTDYWLGIKVSDDSEMTPRQRITSVPTAIRAENAEAVKGTTNIFPADGSVGIGTITPTAALEVGDINTKLLLHCNGQDGSQTFIDEISKTVTANGNAQIDTEQYKFGGASGKFDGTGDYLSIPDSDDWNFGSGDFTIDFWVRFATPLPAVSQGPFFFIQKNVDDSNNRWNLRLYNDEGMGTYLWHFEGYNSSGTIVIGLYRTTTIVADRWYHIAVTRQGDNFRIFQDGIQLGTTLETPASMPDGSADLWIGSAPAGSGSGVSFNGWIDELRISKGIARWTSDFSNNLPTAEYSSGVKVNGNVDITGRYYQNGNEIIPSGVIVMWSGTIANIPSGWALCDGTNGTPDLRDKFVVAAGSTYASGNTGGADNHTHILVEANLPSHIHSAGTLAADSSGAHTHLYYTAGMNGGTAPRGIHEANWATQEPSNSGDTSSSGAHTHTISGSSGSTGSGTSFSGSSLPPYYALAYIMKL